jgi:superoxide dismutase, Fe-Mn family
MISSVSRLVMRRFSTEASKKYTLPELTYNYSELEPVISQKLLEIHHKKHHSTYVNNLNIAL